MKKLVALSVCWFAAAAAIAKPPMTDAQYETVAGTLYMTEMCAVAGHMALDTAAFGRVYVGEAMDRHETDRDRVEKRVEEIKQQFPTVQVESCNKASLWLLETRTKQQAASQPSTPAAQTYMPRYTNCSRYFGQTFCTTY